MSDSEHRAEPHWGDPLRSQVRTDTSRAERIRGLTWLTIGALFGLFVSVLYLGSRITIGETSIPFPWTILFAGWLNWVITRTALLWTPNRGIAVIPMWAWTIGFLLLIAWPAISWDGATFLPNNLWTFALLAAGLVGGVIPVMLLPFEEIANVRNPENQGELLS